MSGYKVGDVVVVTGPLTVGGGPPVFLGAGEVGDVRNVSTELPIVAVWGRDSELTQWIDASSLTPFSEVAEDPDPEIDWGCDEDKIYTEEDWIDYAGEPYV